MDYGSGNGKFFGFGESEVPAMDEMKGDGPMKRSSSGQEPKSSPKRIAAKKVRESPPPRLSFSARLLRIHALGVRKHRNLLIGRHLPTSAFYSAVFQNALAGAL